MTSKTPMGHASEGGTSVLEYLYPELVVKDKMLKYEPEEEKEEIPDLYVYEYFDKDTPTSVLGDPFAGSREKGEAMVKKGIEVMSKFLKEW